MEEGDLRSDVAYTLSYTSLSEAWSRENGRQSWP